MIKTIAGQNDDGTVRFGYELTQEEHEAGMVAFITGPIGGTFAVGDAAYDVSEWAIPVHQDHVRPLQLAIHRAHQAAGRFLDVPLPAE